MTNITYVTFLMKLQDDYWGVEKRLDWVKPLLTMNIPIVLFVDEYFEGLLKDISPSVKVIRLDIKTLDTYRRIYSLDPPPRLPPARNERKDTLDYLMLMNSKVELLVLAKQFVSTPYMAYIDSGISKIFRDPAGTLKRLETLAVHSIPLVLFPGCHPIQPVEVFPKLWKGIHWTLSGGFFVVPVDRVDEFYEIHMGALQRFLDMGCITWEVNVWASFANDLKIRIVWYMGPHTDEMITGIPGSVLK
jgi:hypothetical protein